MEKKPLDQKTKITMYEIRQKKKKLRDDLDLLESGFENRISKVSTFLPGNIHPIKTIQKHPLKSVGLAVLFGTVAGMLTGSEKKNKSKSPSESSAREGFPSLVFNELKRVAAYRAASYISDLMETKMASKNDQ
jgi:hypothetical protein